jgi:hypothetical protein
MRWLRHATALVDGRGNFDYFHVSHVLSQSPEENRESHAGQPNRSSTCPTELGSVNVKRHHSLLLAGQALLQHLGMKDGFDPLPSGV